MSVTLPTIAGAVLPSKRVLLDRQGLSVPHTNFSVYCFVLLFWHQVVLTMQSATFVADSPTGKKPLPRSCGILSQISFDFFGGFICVTYQLVLYLLLLSVWYGLFYGYRVTYIIFYQCLEEYILNRLQAFPDLGT